MKHKLFSALLLVFACIALFAPQASAESGIEDITFLELTENTAAIDVASLYDSGSAKYIVEYKTNTTTELEFTADDTKVIELEVEHGADITVTGYDADGNQISSLPTVTIYTNPISLGDIILENSIYAKEIIETTGDINLNSHMLYVFNDATINTNFKLDGGQLFVGGRLTLSRGLFALAGGTLEVMGNFEIVDAETRGVGYGKLYMTHPDDRVFVHGDFTTDSIYPHTEYLTNGVFRLKGDFTQTNSEGSFLMSRNNFDTDENFKIIFCGDDTQVVYFNDPHRSQFAIWEIENTSENPMEIPHGMGIRTLKQDSVIPCDVTVWSSLFDDRVATPINLNGHTLHVKGDLINGRVNMLINHGQLIVDGSYKLQLPKDIGNGETALMYSYGTLRMLYDDDYILVNGDFIQDSYYSHSKCMLAGTLEVKGDFRQITTNPKDDTHYNFDASGTHRVILSGDGVQVVNFEDPDRNQFNILEIPENDSPGHIILFTSQWRANRIINNSSYTALLNWAE